MKLFPAIDLFDGKVVRLYKGDYAQMTVYSDDPLAVAKSFHSAGAEYLHVVDLEGARSGETPNIDIVSSLAAHSGLAVEIGGGIRSEATVNKYLSAGVMRVILGTAAVTDRDFLLSTVAANGNRVAVGVDIKGENVAIKGWTETSSLNCFDFFATLEEIGVKTVICTDISKDGVMAGTNLSLYSELSSRFCIDIVASGGVSTLDDIRALKQMGIYGAILGKALYTGALELSDALKITNE